MGSIDISSLGNITISSDQDGYVTTSWTGPTCEQVEMLEAIQSFRKATLLPKLIKRVIYNPPATIVMWNDGTKTIVKCMDDEEYSQYYGFCACVCKKLFGSSSAARKAAGIPKKKRSKNVKVFKVGDIVRIKNDLLGAFDVADDMWKYKGRLATITRVLPLDTYRLDVDGGEWNWYETLLERVKK
jgi:hypothetical protein